MANEKRLIDPSVLIRDLTAMKSVYDAIELDGIIKALKEAPAVAAVEVVRCKDCIHRHYVDMGDEIGAIGGCGLFGTPMMTCNDFCSYGERRTDNGKT